MNIAEIKHNEEKNGIEIYFSFYPITGTRENLKKYGFRWNGKKACWYAKKSANVEALASAIADTTEEEYKELAKQAGEEVKPIKAKKTTEKKATAEPEKINLDNLGANAPRLHGAELAKAIREDLKRRGVKGVTVRKRDVTYDTGITVTVRATAEDMASIEEYKNRYTFSEFSCDASNYHGVFDGKNWIYSAGWESLTDSEKETAYNNHVIYYLTKSPDFNNYHHERKNCPSFTTEFYNKIVAIYKIANQWNYDNSDAMTDYFDVGYYLDIDIKLVDGITPRESMTDAERKAYEQEIKAEEEANEKALEKMREDERKAREAEEKRRAWEKEARERIEKNVEIVDLDEFDQIYITALSGGIGKECNLDELKESIAEHITARDEALITRKATFTDAQAFADFCNMFMYDFAWLDGMGGTACNDARLENSEQFAKLTTEQRETIRFYNNNCVGVYFGEELKLVINPEGFGYARYVFIPTEDSITSQAKKELEKQEETSKQKKGFYFPEPVEVQAENLTEGEQVTVYQCDGWILNNIYAGSGTVERVEKGTWAQYEGVYIELSQGRKRKRVFIHDGRACLIYKGILPKLPQEVTEKRISDRMSELYNDKQLMKNAYSYYEAQGLTPIIDTWQR